MHTYLYSHLQKLLMLPGHQSFTKIERRFDRPDLVAHKYRFSSKNKGPEQCSNQGSTYRPRRFTCYIWTCGIISQLHYSSPTQKYFKICGSFLQLRLINLYYSQLIASQMLNLSILKNKCVSA